MQVQVDDLVNAKVIEQRTGCPANKIQTWHTRNSHGIADLALECDVRPPLYLWSQIEEVINRHHPASDD